MNIKQWLVDNKEAYTNLALNLKKAKGAEYKKTKAAMFEMQGDLYHVIMESTNNLQTQAWPGYDIHMLFSLIFRPGERIKPFANCGICAKNNATRIAAFCRENAEKLKPTSTKVTKVRGLLPDGSTMYASLPVGDGHGVHTVKVTKAREETAEVFSYTDNQMHTVERDNLFSTIQLASQASQNHATLNQEPKKELAKEQPKKEVPPKEDKPGEIDPNNFESTQDSVGKFSIGDRMADDDDEWEIIGFPNRYNAVLLSSEGGRMSVSINKLKKNFTPI